MLSYDNIFSGWAIIFIIVTVRTGIEPCQPKPYQPLSNLQFLITEGVSVTNDAAIIHKSPIDRNYCSSTRLSGDKDKRRYSDSNRNTVSGY